MLLLSFRGAFYGLSRSVLVVRVCHRGGGAGITCGLNCNALLISFGACLYCDLNLSMVRMSIWLEFCIYMRVVILYT